MATDHSAKVYPLKKEKKGVGKPTKPRVVILVSSSDSELSRSVAETFDSKYILSEDDYRVNKDGEYIYKEEDTPIVVEKLYNQYTKWLSNDRTPIVIHSKFLGGVVMDYIKSGKTYGYAVNLATLSKST